MSCHSFNCDYSEESQMNKAYVYACILATTCVCAGCASAPEEVEKSAAITNSQEKFQIWDIVIETRQRNEEQSIPLQIGMHGRMKWLRVWDKYCCSSRVRERWGSWFVWMYYDGGKLSYPPVAHAAARPTKTLDACSCIYAHISVPKRGALAKGAYISVQNDMDSRACNSEKDWNDAKRRELVRYDLVEKPDMKGEIRLRVKLFRNSSIRVASCSDVVLSLSAEQCDLQNVRLHVDPTREPQWED